MEIDMKVHMGEFDAESHWDNNTNAKLPSYVREDSTELLDTMDELLFGFSDINDVVITKRCFNKNLKEYLESLDIRFLTYTASEYQKGIDILEKKEWKLDPFAITEYVTESFGVYSKINCFPKLEIIKRVNSKKFSTYLANQIQCNPHKIFIVQNFLELEQAFSILQDKAIVIKEFFGVSGKGSLILKNIGSKNSVLRYLYKQSQNGKDINFIIEEYVDKKIDFSTHILISPDGKMDIVATRMMRNLNLSYLESYEMDVFLKSYLLENGYYETIMKIAEKLYENGYWGMVGIDSMILEDDRIIPLIEINARKSMGLLHYFLEKRLQIENSRLTFLNLKIPFYLTTRDIFEYLDKEKVLFRKGKDGIIPLSGNMLEVDKENISGLYRTGRLYFLVNATNKNEYFSRLTQALKELNIVVY